MSKASKELKRICKSIENKKVRRKMRRALRRSRFRFFKNLFIWFMGFTASLAITAGAIFVGVAVIPINKYVGDGNGVVSEDISSKTIYEAFMSINSYDFSDVPIVETYLKELMKVEIDTGSGSKTKLGDLLTVDYSKLSSTKLTGQCSSIQSNDRSSVRCTNFVGMPSI